MERKQKVKKTQKINKYRNIGIQNIENQQAGVGSMRVFIW